MLAAVIKVMQLVGMEELPGRLVADEGVVVPGVPKADDDAGELARPVVALAVLVVFFAAEVARLVLLAGGDEVPPCPPSRQPIERGELARHVERLVVAGRGGGNEADMAGVGGERR